MAPLSRSVPSRRTSAAAEASSRPVNGSSSSASRGLVNQRALERDALPHAAREAADRIVRRDRRGLPG